VPSWCSAETALKPVFGFRQLSSTWGRVEFLLLVEGQVVVELKSVENLAPVHSNQLLTNLRLLNLRVGLLINFGAGTLKEGLHRIVNRLPASASPHLRVNSPVTLLKVCPRIKPNFVARNPQNWIPTASLIATEEPFLDY
jgi:hypothetical protein